jgi:hypothetical protein
MPQGNDPALKESRVPEIPVIDNAILQASLATIFAVVK